MQADLLVSGGLPEVEHDAARLTLVATPTRVHRPDKDTRNKFYIRYQGF